MRSVRGTAAVLAAALLVAAPVAASAQQTDDDGVELGRQGWEINAHGGYFNDAPEFGPGGLNARVVSGDPLVGGRLGYTFGSGLFVQGEFGYSWDQHLFGRAAGSFQELEILRWGGALGWNLNVTDRLQFFPAVGAGAVTWSPEITDSETDLSVNGGVGLRYFLTPSVALRGDARYHLVPAAMEDIQADISPGSAVVEETFAGVELSAGVSLFLGGPSDADGDGVRDSDDACPDTPREAEVDAEGCPVDSDADGVADYRDECPGTPRGAEVDGSGCPTDSDGDGVYDGLDECPDTPSGAEVDDEGCPTDSDDDGVFDGIDQCPSTPAGAEVDDEGCATDGDGDGVYDGLDECPNSPEGAEVDENGCVTRVVLDEVLFDFDSADIREDAEPTIREVGRALVGLEAEQLRVEIRGHTDAVGPESYNQRLGERRAASVRDWLVEEFDGLTAGMFTVRSFGESQPVASNETEAGRQRNRRVEFVVLQGPERLEGTVDEDGSGGG